MNDKEMLELAAKGAGFQLWWRTPMNASHDQVPIVDDKKWNPLADDGDALRLAVRLKMDVVLCDDDSVVVACWIGDADVANLTEKSTDSQDIYGATRRAIVRAAAEIGKRGA